MAEHSPQIVASEEEATTPHTIEQETLHVMQQETPFFMAMCVKQSAHIRKNDCQCHVHH